jgi:hypothetical protein
MIDRVAYIADFKRIIDELNLNYKLNLRICIREETVDKDGDVVMVQVVLSIPQNDSVLMECVLQKKNFIRHFIHDPAFKESQEYLDLIKRGYDKAREIFGYDIIEGGWK